MAILGGVLAVMVLWFMFWAQYSEGPNSKLGLAALPWLPIIFGLRFLVRGYRRLRGSEQ